MSIGPFVEVIRRAAATDPGIANAARHISTALLRGKNITAEVLRFGRPSSPNFTAFDAVRWIRRVGDEMRTLIPNRIRFELSAPPEPLQITADEHQLTQLLMNLVLNARDAIGRQSGDIRVTLTALPERRSIEISVQDTGPGIPDATAEKIFEPLFTTKPNGTGLGLPVSQQIVERHGGEISLSSSEAGTTFRVVFPMEQ
jgi:signal transduction histidine kinase